MATRKQSPATARAKPRSADAVDHRVSPTFAAIWDGSKKPDWHPIKKMRYVFWRMASGVVIADSLREIFWNASEFWHLVDQKRKGSPFQLEYKRAKTLQSRALVDSVLVIAEGRDPITRRALRRTKRLIKKAMAKSRGQKSVLLQKTIVQELLHSVSEHEKAILGRNKLQIEAAKWIAAKHSPVEYGEKSTLSLGTAGEGDELEPIQIQFVGPDGKVAKL